MTKVGKQTSLAAIIAALCWQPAALAQDEDVIAPTPPPVEAPVPDDEVIEEVIAVGRFISSSQELVNERMTDAFATDMLGADTI